MKQTLRNLTLSLCVLSLASCTDFTAQSSSWWFRYHPEGDEAIYVEIQDGITKNVDAAEPLRRLVGGWRRYPPEGGLMTLDLNEEIDWEEAPESVDIERMKTVFEGLQREVEVVEAGVFRVGQERLGFFRVTHIKDLSLLLEGLNSFCNVVLSEEWAEGIDLTWEHFEIGEETGARWMQRVAENEPWLTRQGSAFVLDIPMTETEAAGFLRAVIADSRDFQPDLWFMEALEQVRVADGSLSLTFSPKGNRFHHNETNEQYSLNEGHAALVEALESDPGFQEFDRAEVLDRVK